MPSSPALANNLCRGAWERERRAEPHVLALADLGYRALGVTYGKDVGGYSCRKCVLILLISPAELVRG